MGGANVLTWSTDVSVSGFQVWRSSSPFALIATLGADDRTYTDQGAAGNASYLVTAFLAGDVGKYTELPDDIPGIGEARGVKPGQQGISTTTSDTGASEPVPGPTLVLHLAGVGLAVLVRRRF